MNLTKTSRARECDCNWWCCTWEWPLVKSERNPLISRRLGQIKVEKTEEKERMPVLLGTYDHSQEIRERYGILPMGKLQRAETQKSTQGSIDCHGRSWNLMEGVWESVGNLTLIGKYGSTHVTPVEERQVTMGKCGHYVVQLSVRPQNPMETCGRKAERRLWKATEGHGMSRNTLEIPWNAVGTNDRGRMSWKAMEQSCDQCGNSSTATCKIV